MEMERRASRITGANVYNFYRISTKKIKRFVSDFPRYRKGETESNPLDRPDPKIEIRIRRARVLDPRGVG